jgi:hypothetical protein
MSGSFSWITLSVMVMYFLALYLLIKNLKLNHSEIYEGFGGKRVWYSAPDQLRFFGFLFGFKYLKLNIPKLTANAILVKALLILGVYFIFTKPIYFHAQL